MSASYAVTLRSTAAFASIGRPVFLSQQGLTSITATSDSRFQHRKFVYLLYQEFTALTSYCAYNHLLPPRFALGVSMNCPSGANREVIRILIADSNHPQSQWLSSALGRQSDLRVTNCRGGLSETPRVFVKKSLFRIYDKLSVSNRVEPMLYALTHRGTERASSPLAKAVGSCFRSTSKHLDDRISTRVVDTELQIEEELQRHLLAPLQRMRVHDSHSRNALED